MQLNIVYLCFLSAIIYGTAKGEPELVRDLSSNPIRQEIEDNGREIDYNEERSKIYRGGSKVPRPELVADWPKVPLPVGQVTAVSVNSRNQPVVFHRAQRVWDESSFNESNVYQNLNEGPIAEETILVLDPHTGAILDAWGGGAFYMPHGLTVDRHDNVWVTDVAMHQVFKYVPFHKYPLLTIGQRFRAGYPNRRTILLCMPTSVAVASTGEVFIADGYCNNQILKLNAAGALLEAIPRNGDTMSLHVPHSLALLENRDVVCVADRENWRIVCPSAGLKSQLDTLDPPLVITSDFIGRVFGIAAYGDYVFVVNGPTDPNIPVRGFTVVPKYGGFVDTWGPKQGFTSPHTVAVTRNGSHLYVGEIGPNKLWKFELTDDNP